MVKIIKHKELNKELLLEIVHLKKLSWDYPISNHLKWIEENIRENDIHFLLYDNDLFVAYMNLVEVHVRQNDKQIPFWGIGNVCSKYKGRGDGKKLMNEVNSFLTNNSFYGLLFCKKHLVEFYNKFDWKLITNLYPKDEVFTMVYNYNKDTFGFTYNDRLF